MEDEHRETKVDRGLSEQVTQNIVEDNDANTRYSR